MKRFTITLLSLFLVFGLVACGGNSNNGGSSEDDTVIKIGATPTPHAEILEIAKGLLEQEGYTLEITEFNDYVLPNTAVEDGELDANFFQHIPYMDNFNEENGTHIVSVGPVHYEPMGIFPGKSNDLTGLANGATVLVPNDTTNEARALLLLEANGLIKIKADAGLTATVLDIEENPLNLEITEVEAAQIVRSLPDVDIAVVNGNYALQGGLSIGDALAIESADSVGAQTYANVLSVKEGNENLPKIQALYKALTSQEVIDFIANTYGGSVVSVVE